MYVEHKLGGGSGLSGHWKWCMLQAYQAQQITLFIGGNKLQHPFGDEEYKFMRNVNGGMISVPDGELFLDLRW